MNHTVAQREASWKQEESRPNLTGIPSQMKRDFESRSQMSYDDVRVHYNSDLPAKVGALAYTQGTRVYLGPGQGRYLRHELTHVAQQKAGLVAPTTQIGGLPVNNDPTLERLADSGIVPRVPATLTVQRQVLQRAPGDAQNSKPLPSIAEIVIQRLYELLIQQNLLTKDKAVNPQDMDIWNDLAEVFQQLDREHKNIRKVLRECGIPKSLAESVVLKIERPKSSETNDKYLHASCTLISYYSEFENHFGQDVRKLDQRAGNGTRGSGLVNLVAVLAQFVLPRVEKAVEMGRQARSKQHGQGIEQLLPQDWRGKMAFWLDGSDLAEGTTRFNYLAVNQKEKTAKRRVPKQVTIGLTPFGGKTVSDVRPLVGKEEYGFAAGPSQVVHEHGHLLENNLGVHEFANLHRFLRMRSKSDDQGKTGWGISGSGWGYIAELPPMEVQNWLSRRLPSYHSAVLCGLFNLGNWSLSLATKLMTLGLARDRGQRFVDDFFLQESNSETTSYATQIYSDYSTEFVSTTAELLSTVRGARKVIEADPTRVAIFFYLADKGFYNDLKVEFKKRQKQAGLEPVSLDEFLHIK